MQASFSVDVTPENVERVCRALHIICGDMPAAADNTPQSPEIPGQTALSEEKKTRKPRGANVSDKPAPTKPDTAQPEPEKNKSEAAPTMTDLRAVATKLAKAGAQDTIKTIFAKYGADKLSSVPEADYAALMVDLAAAAAKV